MIFDKKIVQDIVKGKLPFNIVVEIQNFGTTTFK